MSSYMVVYNSRDRCCCIYTGPHLPIRHPQLDIDQYTLKIECLSGDLLSFCLFSRCLTGMPHHIKHRG